MEFAPNAFICEMSYYNYVSCNSKGGGSFSIRDNRFRLYNWYLLVVRSTQTNSDMYIETLAHIQIKNAERRQFFPFNRNPLTATSVFLGIESNKDNGIRGSVKELRVFSKWMQRTLLSKITHTKLYWTPTMELQILAHSLSLLENEIDNTQVQVVGRGQIKETKDFTGITWCFQPIKEDENFLKFDGTNKLKVYNIRGHIRSRRNIQIFAWVLRDHLIKTTQDEYIFDNYNLMRVSIKKNSYSQATYTAYNTNSVSFNMPFNVWIMLQTEVSISYFSVFAYTHLKQELHKTDNQYIPGSPIYRTSTQIMVGYNFNGLIRGIEYFQADQKFGPELIVDYPFKISSRPGRLFYFIFTEFGIAQNKRFYNFEQSQGGTMDASSTIQFTKKYWNNQDGSWVDGTLEQEVNFDGFTCSDNENVIYFPDTDSYAKSIFSLSEDTKSMSVEFWMRTLGIDSLASSLVNLETDGISFFSIQQMQSRGLKCQPFQDRAHNAEIKYEDYRNDVKDWIHVSCGWDGKNSILSGYLYQQGQTISYIKTQDDKGNIFPSGSYGVYINNGIGNLKKGIRGVKYKEFRVWSQIRNREDVMYQRNHMIDISNNLDKLLSYIKFGNGGFKYASEIDYGDLISKREVILSNYEWVQDTSQKICPFQTFLNLQDNLCYLDPFLTMRIGAIQNLTHLIISPQFSEFVNRYSREEAGKIFNMRWTLKNIRWVSEPVENQFRKDYFVSQQNNYALQFPLNQLVEGSVFELKLLVTNNLTSFGPYDLDFQHRVWTKCNIFDGETGLSDVSKDLVYEKDQSDIIFRYDFTDCGDYLFKKGKLNFFYMTQNHKDLVYYKFNHDPLLQRITLQKKTQRDIPLNEYFYLAVKGEWDYKYNSYYDSEKYLMYKLRFVSRIQVNIKTSNNPVLEGKTMVLDASESYITNVDSNYERNNYQVKWSCPQQLQTFCKDGFRKLSISFNQFRSSGLQFWKKYEIGITLQTAQISGTELSKSSQQVGIIWLDVIPDVSLFGSNAALHNKVNVWTLQVNNIPTDKINVKWTVTPYIAPKKYLNDDYKLQLVMDKGSFSLSSDYKITAEVIYSPEDVSIWKQTITVVTPRPPFDGYVQVNPKSGASLTTAFSLKVDLWDFVNAPIKYQFYFQKGSSGKLKQISPLIENEKFVTALPSCTKIWVKVTDDFDAESWARTNIQVNFQSETLSTSQQWDLLVQRVKDKKARNDYTYWSDIHAMAASLPDYDKALNSFADSRTTRSNVAQLFFDNYKDMLQPKVPEADQLFFFSQAILIIEAVTEDKRMLNIPIFIKFEKAIEEILGSNYIKNIMKDDLFKESLLQSQSNMFASIQFLVDQGKHQKEDKHERIALLTASLRKTLLLIEKTFSIHLPEGMEFSKETESFSIRIEKHSTFHQHKNEEIQLNGPKTSFQFPIKKVPKESTRQSVSLIEFKINPFLGYVGGVETQPVKQVLVGDSTVHIAYRDINGDEIDVSDFDVGLSFKDLSMNGINTTISACAYFDEKRMLWKNETCSTVFSKNGAQCSCPHLSFYSIVEDYGRRPPRLPPVLLAFRDWPSIVVVLYILGITVFLVVYVIIRDQEDIRALRIQDSENGYKLSKSASFTVVSLAFKRKVFLMAFGQKYSICTLWRTYCLLLHPLFSLKHNFDPSLPKILKVFTLLFRIIAVMAGCFFFLYDEENADEVFIDFWETDQWEFWKHLLWSGMFAGSFSLIFAPLPNCMYKCCRSRFKLVYEKYSTRDDDFSTLELEDKKEFEKKTKEEPYYVDPTLPIKLLFILKTTTDLKLVAKDEAPWASGKKEPLAQILDELEFSKLDSVVYEEPEKPEPTSQVSHVLTDRRLMQSQAKENMIQDVGGDLSNIEAVQDNSRVNPGDVTFELKEEMKEGGEDEREAKLSSRRSEQPRQEASIQNTPSRADPDSIIKRSAHKQHYSHHPHQEFYFGESIVPSYKDHSMFEDKLGVTHDDFMVQRFGSAITFNSEDIIDEKKEIVEQGGTCCRIFFGMILLLMIFGGFGFVMYIYFKEDSYNSDPKYMWVAAFFLSQLIGFFVIDFILLSMMSCCAGGCCRQKIRCMLGCMKESYTIYDDLRFSMRAQEAHFTS